MHVLSDTALNMNILQCFGRVCACVGGASNRMTVELVHQPQARQQHTRLGPLAEAGPSPYYPQPAMANERWVGCLLEE